MDYAKEKGMREFKCDSSKLLGDFVSAVISTDINDLMRCSVCVPFIYEEDDVEYESDGRLLYLTSQGYENIPVILGMVGDSYVAITASHWKTNVIFSKKVDTGAWDTSIIVAARTSSGNEIKMSDVIKNFIPKVRMLIGELQVP